jgi:hypothetical protein
MSDPLPFQVHSAARGPRWVGWVTIQGENQPFQSVVLVAATREKAEARAREWAERVLAEPGETRPTSDF